MKKKDINVVAITLRYPEDLHEALMDEAATEGRSFNAHVVWILRQHVNRQQKIDKKTTKKSVS